MSNPMFVKTAIRWKDGATVLVATALLAGSMFSSVVHAQAQRAAANQSLTVETLIGPVVEQIGPQYRPVEDAISLFLSNDQAGARGLLEEAAKTNPELPPAGIMMAKMYFASNNAKGALSELERAAKEAPNDPESFIIQGDVSLQQRQFSGAQLLYESGLRKARNYDKNPKRQEQLLARVYSGMAYVAQGNQDWPQAENLLREWLKVDSNDVNAKVRLAEVLFQKGSPDDKKACYQLLEEVYNSNPQEQLRPEIAIAKLFDNVDKNQEQAVKLMKLAQERDSSLSTQLQVCQWSLEAGQMDLAKAAAAAAEKSEPNALESLLINGLLAMYQEDFSKASNLFTKAHIQSPSNPVAMSQLALILIESPNEGDRRRASEYAQLNASLYSRYDQSHAREAALTLAWVLHRMGRSNESIQIVRKVLEQPGTVDSSSLYYAAVILHEQGQDDPARKILDAILETGKNFVTRDDAKQLRDSLQ